jgi:alginate O-acetyltransferase complex protein AlgJ
MFNMSSLRHRYAQFFVLFMLCSSIFVMVESIGPGVTNFQENFYNKNFLIRKANLLRTKVGDRILPRALIGKDGWVDYTGDGNIDDFQNLKPFDLKEELILRLKTLNQYLESQGITLLVVIAPNKATIYPDKLPDQIKSLPTESRLDRLIKDLKDNDLPIMVDLRPSLRVERDNQDVYFPQNNTHWNGYGAFVAYTTIINVLKSSYPELTPYQIADMKLAMPSDPRLSILGPYFVPKDPFVQTLHLSDDNGRYQFAGVDYGYNQFSSIPDSNLPTLLMFHDSFGAFFLNDYLGMNFAKSHFVHIFGQNEVSPYFLSKESIQQFKPDVVIIEVVERDLEYLVPLLGNFIFQ